MRIVEHRNELDCCCFYIAHGPSLHFGGLAQGDVLSTGQKFLDVYEDMGEWKETLLRDFDVAESELEGFEK